MLRLLSHAIAALLLLQIFPIASFTARAGEVIESPVSVVPLPNDVAKAIEENAKSANTPVPEYLRRLLKMSTVVTSTVAGNVCCLTDVGYGCSGCGATNCKYQWIDSNSCNQYGYGTCPNSECRQ